MTAPDLRCHGMDCCWDCFAGRPTHPPVDADCGCPEGRWGSDPDARRRLVSRTTARAGVLAALALVASCADTAEAVQVCAAHLAPFQRVDDRVCATPANRAEADGYGWYSLQLPPTEYDDDDYPVFVPIVVPDVGQPVPRGQAGGYSRGTPRVDPQRVVVPPARASTPGGTTVSRGGLGVSSVGSSSGS